MINYVELDIDKSEFLISKLDGRNYNPNIGNFCKHLIKFGFDIKSYTTEFYKDKIPTCIESGELSDYKIVGYWNRWWPILYKHRRLLGLTKTYLNKVNTIKRKNLYTEYLSMEYWQAIPKYSERIRILNWLIDKKWYIRLHDSFYDETWTIAGKEMYIKSILNQDPIILKPIDTLQGMMQRGNAEDIAFIKMKELTGKRKPNKRTFKGMQLLGYSDDVIPGLLKEYYDKKPCCRRNNELQKTLSDRRLAKYTKDELKYQSVRCKEYWMKCGYSLDEAIEKVRNIQITNSIPAIIERLKCSNAEAEAVQFEIYDRRAKTFLLKSADEIADINKRKDSGSYEYCLRKCNYDKVDANKLYKELIIKKIVPFGKASKESLVYFKPLYKQLRKCGIHREDIYFGINGSKEHYLEDNKCIKFYDFTILSKRLIIEYDGIHWHSSEEAKMNDDIKTNLAVLKGFNLLRISSKNTIDENKKTINEFIKKYLSFEFANW